MNLRADFRCLPLQRLFLFAMLLLASLTARADDLKYHAQLIWGTDDEKPSGKNLTPVGMPLKEKLCGVFKWKNYFVVGAQDIRVSAGGNAKAKLSDKCELEIQDMGKGAVEAKLIGEGKLWSRIRKTIPQGEHLILAGDDKNSTAWFVIVTPGQ